VSGASRVIVSSIVLFLISIFAGTLGAILGLGGGIVIIPTLTLFYGVDIRYAIGASIVSIIATSSGAAASYVRDHMTNVKLAIFLEVGTTIGAATGAVLAGLVNTQFLFILFALTMFQSAWSMWKKARFGGHEQLAATSHPWSISLGLNSSYPDSATQSEISYQVENVPIGLAMMLLAGLLSGLLGIGSGVLKVLAMDTAMKLPIKVSSATSNFMIGVTAAASAGAYFMRGEIIPAIAAPVAVGVLVGSWVGARIMVRLPAQRIRQAFVIVLLIVGCQMITKGLGL
jgi:uncharacterized membrane protein YfcA